MEKKSDERVNQWILSGALAGISAASAGSEGVDWIRLIEVAASLGAPAVVIPLEAYQPGFARRALPHGIAIRLENVREKSIQCVERIKSVREKNVSFAFNPAHFAAAGEKPFLRVYVRGPLKRCLTQLYVNDATLAGEPSLPGRGNAEIKEMISILRCSSFDGPMTLKSVGGPAVFAAQMEAFWKLLDSM